MRLVWDENFKDLVVSGECSVTCRRATHEDGPLQVFCPSTWTVSAGLGGYPWAWDVNVGWHRDDRGEPDERPAEGVNEVFLQWFGRTVDEWRNFIEEQR